MKKTENIDSIFEKYYQNKIVFLEKIQFSDIFLDINFYQICLKKIWKVQELTTYLLDVYSQKQENLLFNEYWILLPKLENSLEMLEHKAREKNEEFLRAYAKVINNFTFKFALEFCDDGQINWQKIVKFNSKKTEK